MSYDKKSTVKEEIKEIQKPTSVIIKEFKEQIYSLIDAYKLHPTMSEMLFKDIYIEAKLIADNQLKFEERNYMQQLEEQKKQKESSQ